MKKPPLRIAAAVFIPHFVSEWGGKRKELTLRGKLHIIGWIKWITMAGNQYGY